VKATLPRWRCPDPVFCGKPAPTPQRRLARREQGIVDNGVLGIDRRREISVDRVLSNIKFYFLFNI
jgi:hypothetical protein